MKGEWRNGWMESGVEQFVCQVQISVSLPSSNDNLHYHLFSLSAALNVMNIQDFQC